MRATRTAKRTEAPVRAEECFICHGRIWLKATATVWVHDTGRSMSPLVYPHAAMPMPIRGRGSQE